MVDVAEPSLAFVALCAFVTERDLHALRRLGRSCARCADLFWARDGRARHRALQLDTARVRSLNDDAADALLYEGSERHPVGLLAFIDIVDDALEHANLPFGELFLFARRVMQDDRHVLLYLLTFAVITDRTLLVEPIVAQGEAWHDDLPLADPPSIVLGRPAKGRGSGESQQLEGDDEDEVAAAMSYAVDKYRRLSDDVGTTTTSTTTDSSYTYEDESETEIDGESPSATRLNAAAMFLQSTRSAPLVLSPPRVVALSHSAQSVQSAPLSASARSRGDTSARTETSSVAQRHLNDFYSAWWPELGVHDTRVLRKYFNYLYPGRTDLTFDDREALAQMTLAERLMALAAIWRSNNVAQQLMSIPVFRCNTSMTVFFACCNRLQLTLHKAAEELAAVEEVDRSVLLPAGVARLKEALTHPCKSLAAHFRRLGTDAAVCEALARYVDPKQRPLLEDEELELLRNYVRRDGVDDDGEPAPLGKQEPTASFDVSASFINEIDYEKVFWFACERDNLALAREMVEKHGAVANANENYAVRLAARYDSVEVLDWLLTLDGVEPGAANNAALCTAVDVGAHRVVRSLLACGKRVDPAVGDNYPLCRATERDDHAIIELLLDDERVDVNARESTPIMNALRARSITIALVLRKELKFAIDIRALGALTAVHRELTAVDDDDEAKARTRKCCVQIAADLLAEIRTLV